jgi:hypothetical protein
LDKQPEKEELLSDESDEDDDGENDFDPEQSPSVLGISCSEYFFFGQQSKVVIFSVPQSPFKANTLRPPNKQLLNNRGQTITTPAPWLPKRKNRR